MSNLARAFNINDLAGMARARLPKGMYDYIDRGAEDEVTLRANSDSIRQILFRPSVAVDVSRRDVSTTLFGTRLSMPLGISVTALSALAAYDGERSLARAAAEAGIPYMIGSTNFTPQQDIKEICGDLTWRQIYPPKNRDLLRHHLTNARAAGIRVLVLTLDSAVTGNREYMQRNDFIPGTFSWRTYGQILAAPHWLFGTLLRYWLHGGMPQFMDMPEGERKFVGGNFSWAANADDFTWDEVRALRREWQDVLVLKGISTAEDARRAVEVGADGIIVSNHGGRSLDSSVPSFGALPEVIDAAAAKVAVMVDGGFRRGVDVLKAIALGASAVFVGRATLYGLTAGGQAGVDRALAIFREEIDRSLALIGCRTLDELSPSQLIR